MEESQSQQLTPNLISEAPASPLVPPSPAAPDLDPVSSGQSPSEKPYAKLIIRYAAMFTDGIITSLLSVPILIFSYALTSNSENVVASLLQIVVVFGYSVVLIKLHGATWGKKFFKIKVVRTSGTEITWTVAFLREVVGRIISTVVLMLGFIWAIFDKRKQSWHDKIAGTIVVQDEPISKARRILAYIIAIPIPLALLGVLAVVVLVSINPVQQLARTRDAGRQAAVSQLGHAVQSYYQSNSRYPQTSNTWITALVSAGSLGIAPTEIVNSVDSAGAKCASTAGSQNGFCYESSLSGAVVYTLFEAHSSADDCSSFEKAWFVYSTVDGRSGTVCLDSNAYPKPGVQTFAGFSDRSDIQVEDSSTERGTTPSLYDDSMMQDVPESLESY